MPALRHATFVLACLAAGVIAACKPGDFDDLESRAPIRVYGAPDGFVGTQFGKVVTGFSGELDGQPASRVVASGGPETSYEVYPVWTGGLELGDPVFQGCERGECAALGGGGTAFAGIPKFTTQSLLEEQQMCILVPFPPGDEPKLHCETSQGVLEGIGTGLTGIGLGEAAVGLGADNPVGFALLGAPAANGGVGGVFALRRDGTDPTIQPMDEVDLTAASLGANAELGSDLAVERVGGGRTWLAAAAPGMQRVVVAELADGGAAVDTTVLGCFDVPAGGPGSFGSSVDLADVDGDGLPDIAVGADTTTTPTQDVFVYSGAGLGGAAGCAMVDDSDDPGPRMLIRCEGDLDGLRDVDCGGSSFGARVALGDLEGDGRHELLVGAPLATVDGKAEAGAVYVIPFDAAGTPLTGQDDADVLVHSSPAEGDELGASLATVETNLDDVPRDEVVAGMPGTDAIAVFLCSSLQQDTLSVGRRCIPGN